MNSPYSVVSARPHAKARRVSKIERRPGAAILVLIFFAALFPGKLQADLVYHLPFDDGTAASLVNYGTIGGTATAVALHNNPAIIPSASGSSVAPGVGGAYSEYFPWNTANNQGGMIVLPDSSDKFRLTSSASPMTLSTWVYWSGSGAGILTTMPADNTTGWSLRITSAGILRLVSVSSTGTSSNIDSTGTLVAGQWTHVVLTWNGSQMAYYLNGALDKTNTLGIRNTGSQNIALGVGSHSSNPGGNTSLKGNLDDFAMWDTVLTAAEIKALDSAPALLNGYNAGVMNTLFTAYDGQSSSIVGSLVWTYAEGFDTTGRTLGDTWGGSGDYYLWLGNDGATALGMHGILSTIPEPAASALMLSGVSSFLLIARRRIRAKEGRHDA